MIMHGAEEGDMRKESLHQGAGARSGAHAYRKVALRQDMVIGREREHCRREGADGSFLGLCPGLDFTRLDAA
jgi:hypothetical protein